MKNVSLKQIILLLFILVILPKFANAAYLLENSTWEAGLTKSNHGTVALGDVDKDGDLDLALIGCTSMISAKCTAYASKIFINNGVNLTQSVAWQQNLTGVNYGSLAWGDINNDGWLDLILTGCKDGGGYVDICNSGGAYSSVYINNGSTLIENTTWKGDIVDVWRSSIALGDMDSDGDLDLALTGQKISPFSRVSKIYINNGTGFTESSTWQSSLTGVDSSAVVFGDIDGDNDLDLALSGEDTGYNPVTKIYLNNGSTLTESTSWSSNLLSVIDSSLVFGDYDNDGDLDLSLIGCCDRHRIYENNGSTFVQVMREVVDGLVGVFAGSEAFGDYDNDGDLDLISTGCEEHTYVYLYNGTSFTRWTQDPESQLMDLEYSSLVWGDLDLDEDLDLIMTGWGNITYQAFVYINNITTPNTPPLAPNVSSMSASYANGKLTLSWDSGNDNETAADGLYYNLRVGTSSGGHQIVTGVYGGGDDNGYFGNMMQRKQIVLNLPQLQENDTVFWAVQTIDTGLRAGNWSPEQNYTVSDAGYPAWTSNQSHYPATYNASFLSHFNITWTDLNDISHAWLESNFSGSVQTYAMSNSSADVWNYSVILPAGSHYWKSYANDTYGNINWTDAWEFTIAKANSEINLTLNGSSGNISFNEGTSVWLNGTLITGDSVVISLYVNGALHNTGNSPISNYTNFTTPGLHNITLVYSSQNYTDNSVTYWVDVNDTTAPIVQSHSPTVPVTSSLATLTVNTNEDATCRFSLTAGTGYASMTYTMSTTNNLTHTYPLTGLTTGDKHYYVRCNNTYGLVSTTDYDASFTVNIQTSGGGGGGYQPPASQTEKSVTFSNPGVGMPHLMSISLKEVDVTKVVFVNSKTVRKVTVSVKKLNKSEISKPLENAYQYMNITLKGLYANEIESSALEFRVNKSWLRKGGFSKNDVKLRRYNYGLWQLIDANWLKETAINHYYNATLPGFSIFAITAEPEPLDEEEKKENVTEVVILPKQNLSVDPDKVIEEETKPKRAYFLIILGVLFVITSILVLLALLKMKKRESTQGR